MTSLESADDDSVASSMPSSPPRASGVIVKVNYYGVTRAPRDLVRRKAIKWQYGA